MIKADLEQATSLSALPDQVAAACNLSVRHVLMRCGPPYSLDGLLTRAGTSQNRVVLDALPLAVGPTDLCGVPGEAQAPLGVCLQPESAVLTVRLAQQLSGGTSPTIQTEKAFAAPVQLDQPSRDR